jgi:hypothetical protein
VPNVVNNFDVAENIFAIHVQNEAIVVGECECIITILVSIGDDRSIIKLIARLNP